MRKHAPEPPRPLPQEPGSEEVHSFWIPPRFYPASKWRDQPDPNTEDDSADYDFSEE